MIFIHYIIERGGTVCLQKVDPPEKTDWGCPLTAFKQGLDYEKMVNGKILELHALADSKNDTCTANFLETYFIEHQVEEIKEMGDMISRLTRAGHGVGITVIDQELLCKHGGKEEMPKIE